MKKKKIILIGGIAAVLLTLGVGFVFLSQGSGGPLVVHLSLESPVAAASSGQEVAAIPTVPPNQQGIMVDLGAKVVNLADPGGYRYLRAGIVIEFAPSTSFFYTLPEEERAEEVAKITEAVEKQRPIIDDAVISHLSDKTFSDVFNFEGKESLKQELSAAINERLDGLEIEQVYFTDFVVQ